jgi:hypothetical protein
MYKERKKRTNWANEDKKAREASGTEREMDIEAEEND